MFSLSRQGALDDHSKPHHNFPRVESVALLLLTLLLLLAQMLPAQTISGSISGRITDAHGAAVPQASITAANQEQNIRERTPANGEGQFVFPILPPGRYTITVEAQNFKTVIRRDVVLNANSTVALGALQLEVGTVVQTVEVVAEGQGVQLDTAQRGDSIIGQQIQDVQVNGQSPLFFTRTVPGVVSRANLAESTQQYGTSNINGSQSTSLHVMVNGGTNQDTGANGGWMAPISLDNVQEVTVLTSNYQAQYGRSSGGQISIVTKSGSSTFHGSAFEYFRDRGLTANSWMNNRVGTPKPAYHYHDVGFNFGGPITIPQKFNTNRSKLFFFWSEEWHRQLVPSGTRNVTVPTQAERDGNFSASVNKNGNAVVIRDPITRTPYPGKVIPPSQIYGPGRALLNLFPLPNAVDPLHLTYNYTSQASIDHPRREDLLRVDYNLNSKWRIYGHMLRSDDITNNPYGVFGTTSNIPNPDIAYTIPGYHIVVNATTTIGPTAVNEITVSRSNDDQYEGMRKGSNAMTRASTGVNFPTLFPPYQDLVSGWSSFNGNQISNSPTFSTTNSPFHNRNTVTEVIDNFSKKWNNHLLKLGAYYMFNWKIQPVGTAYSGTYDFGDDTSNPLDTGFGFANAANGVFGSFTQSTGYAEGWPNYNQFEFYIQDGWKATPRLTLDYGVRFYYMGPVYNAGGELANFFPATFKPASAPRLLRPGFNASGARVAVDPATGQTYDVLFIGAYAPGTGDIQNGIRILKEGEGITKSPGLLAAPRIGFAYDLTGHGTLALRGGAGISYNRTHTDPYIQLLGNPPLTQTLIVNYGLASALSSSQAILRAPSLNTWSDSSSVPTTYQFSLGLESRLPKQLFGSVSYVGSVSNHLLERVDINEIPFGAAFLPENQDATLQKASPNALIGSNALVSQLLRPFVGFNSITMKMFAGNSNYNSLQATLNRRFATGLMLGIAYTWSKCLNIADSESTVRHGPYNHDAFYGPCGYDLRHNFVANYIYTLPKFASWLGRADGSVTRSLLNDWQISGFTTFQTGTPYSPGMSVAGVTSINFTGTPNWGPKLLCVSDPLSGTSKDPYNRLNPAGFALPPIGSIGLGCSRNNLYSPGLNNWDLSLQKIVQVKERLKVVLRGEAFNVFNHTQFTGINSTLNFSGLTNPTYTNLPYNSSGKLTNITGFGTVSGVASPRIMQLVMKVQF